MTRHFRPVAAVPMMMMILSIVSCRSNPPVPATPAPAAPQVGRSADAPRPETASKPYEGPKVSIDVHSTGGVSQARVTVNFRTGGWELRADSSSVTNGVGIARLTLIGPASNEMVTQALDQKVWTWPSKEPFERAEVWVKVIRRGASPPSPAASEYRLAARYP